MTSYPIPDAALDDRLAFVGTSGSGKTYAAGTAVEKLLTTRARVVITDPLGVWYGLRLQPDGKAASSFPVVIFGGQHGDLSITEHSGKLVGEAVAGMAESCIIALDGLGSKSAERRFMLAFLETLYRKASGDPLHLIFDEADLWAPQKSSEPPLQALMENIVRRGRVKGFIPWLITQRPAVLSKDVLSQADGLVAMKLTASQDRDALGGWIEGQADRAEEKRILARLPQLETGQGVVWIPGRGALAEASFPAKATFDSSRTPKRGEKRRTAALKPIDLGALRERLGRVEAEANANDPQVLKARIAELERNRPSADAATMKAAEVAAYERGRADGFQSGVGAGAEAGWKEAGQLVADLFGRAAPKVRAGTPDPISAPPKDPQPPATPAPCPAAMADAGERPLGAERRPLAVLASVYPAGMTEAQWAVGGGLKRTGGTWSTYVSRLRTAGRIEKRGELWFATERGFADMGDAPPVMPPPGPELVEFWCGKIPGVGPMLRRLVVRWPAGITRDALASELGLAPSGGTFGTYLSRLRAPGLIEIAGGEIRAADSLFPGGGG